MCHMKEVLPFDVHQKKLTPLLDDDETLMPNTSHVLFSELITDAARFGDVLPEDIGEVKASRHLYMRDIEDTEHKFVVVVCDQVSEFQLKRGARGEN